MAESVNLLLENPDLADKLGKMGRERASALFDRERMLSRLEQVLAEAMRGWKEQRRKLSP